MRRILKYSSNRLRTCIITASLGMLQSLVKRTETDKLVKALSDMCWIHIKKQKKENEIKRACNPLIEVKVICLTLGFLFLDLQRVQPSALEFLLKFGQLHSPSGM